MKKCIIIPDSFKGTMSALEFCQIAEKTVKRHMPGCEVLTIPVADGGEGTVDCFVCALGAEKIERSVCGPWQENVSAAYCVKDGTAFIEMAQAAGLPMVGEHKNPAKTTTFGVGSLIRDAVEQGCKSIVIGLGGSCTNDGGSGCAAALGVRFENAAGEPFVPTGGTLAQIRRIDLSGARELLAGVKITAMCDVDNPLCGPECAAAVFGPQKGANVAMIARLDAGLKHLAEVSGKAKLASMPSAGAAGGMGFGMMAFFNCPLQMGIDGLLDIIDFESILAGADLVLTGEGRIDPQSMRGKTVIGVARRASKCGVPTIAVVGDIADGIESAYDLGVSAIFSINRVAMERKLMKLRAKSDMEATVENIIRAVKAVKL